MTNAKPWVKPLRLAVLLPAFWLVACAHYAPDPQWVGQSVDAVLAKMGPPTLRTPQALVYARGPMGRHTWFVMIDPSGRVMSIEQRLREDVFIKVLPEMTQTQVLDLLGPPSEQQLLGRGRGRIWSWRYENNLCLWFQAEITTEGRVRSAGYGPMPECDHLENSR